MNIVKFRINNCTRDSWWWCDIVGTYIDIDLDTACLTEETHNDVDTFECIQFVDKYGIYHSIYVHDIGYYNYIRKQKLDKICSKKETK